MKPETTTYRKDIDGIRAIAVTSVVMFHAGIFPVRSGFVGVDIFFVISGFLIGGIVFRDSRRGSFDFTAFYIRRAKRILPALTTVVLFSTAIGTVILSPDELRRFSGDAVSALLGFSNVLFWHESNYFAPDAQYNPLLMTWSLGVEEQFYLCLPLLLTLTRRRSPRTVMWVLAIVSMLSISLTYFVSPTASFFLLPTRSWELASGTLLAVYQSTQSREGRRRFDEVTGVLGIIAVSASLFIFDESVPFPGTATLLPVLGTVALLASEHSVVNRRILSTPPMVAVGLVSYSWYLWHWPLLAFLRVCSARPPSVTALSSVALLSLGLAIVSWRIVELRFRYARGLGRSVLRRYAVMILGCTILLVGLRLNHGLPERVDPGVVAVEALLARGRGGPCLANESEAQLNTSSDCISADARPRLVLIGDSHAAALSPGLRSVAQKAGLGFEEFSKNSCPPLLETARLMPMLPGQTSQCTAYNRERFATIADDPQARTIILAAYWSAPFEAPGDAYIDTSKGDSEIHLSSAKELRAALKRTEDFLVAAHKNVIVLGDVPHFDFDPAREVITSLMPSRRWVESLIEPRFRTSRGIAPASLVVPPVTAGRIVEEVASSKAGVQYFPLASRFCNEEGCRFSCGSMPLYIDPQHLSSFGADYASAVLARALH